MPRVCHERAELGANPPSVLGQAALAEVRIEGERLAAPVALDQGKGRRVDVAPASIDSTGGAGPHREPPLLQPHLKATLSTAAQLSDSIGIFHRGMLKSVNGYIYKHCPKYHPQDQAASAAPAKQAPAKPSKAGEPTQPPAKKQGG